jgi:hypothetical protein
MNRKGVSYDVGRVLGMGALRARDPALVLASRLDMAPAAVYLGRTLSWRRGLPSRRKVAMVSAGSSQGAP